MVDYHVYINSNAWRKRRSKLLAKRKTKGCHACGSVERLDVHHLTYARLGNERDSDLVALCRYCHAEIHKRHRSNDHNLKLISITRDFIKRSWMRHLSRPPQTGQWGKKYQREWQKKHKENPKHGRGCSCHNGEGRGGEVTQRRDYPSLPGSIRKIVDSAL